MMRRSVEGSHAMKNFSVRVNGHDRQVKAEPDTPLLYVLHNDLNLKGVEAAMRTAQEA
jgi:aerobic-type carbon monoxide dehydrogenase small subunit (CoxS/CutS family)